MKKSAADKFSDSSAVVLMLIIGATLNPAGLRAYGGEESISTASTPANESTSAPGSAIDPTIFERPKLTGNWWGARDTLEAHGVTLDVSLAQFYQGVTDGGIDRDFEYGGKLGIYVNLDGGKAGLWQGVLITTHVGTPYGEEVNDIDGLVFAEQGPEFTFLVRDPDHHPTTIDLDKLFAHGVLLTGSLRLPVAPFGLPGTQVFGGNWSSRHYTSLDPSDWENVPGQGLPAPEESGSWAIWYNADQTLWINSANTNQWLGVFEMSGLSDGNPNSVRWNVTVGLGAGGLVPSREHDTMGVAYFHIGVSDEVKDLLASQPGLAQRDEQGVELYYNAALSPWCHLTADLQVAQPSTKAFDTAVLAGSRLKIDF